MQLDVGFGDVVHPSADVHNYPTLLGHPAPRLRMYPRETVVAEKFHAMVHLGSLNSRMKDFYDVWLVSRRFDFEGHDLARAIQKTFAHRRTDIEVDPIALGEAFATADSTRMKWTSFVKRSRLEEAPSFGSLQDTLRGFLLPVAAAAVSGERFWRTGRRDSRGSSGGSP